MRRDAPQAPPAPSAPVLPPVAKTSSTPTFAELQAVIDASLDAEGKPKPGYAQRVRYAKALLTKYYPAA